MTRDDIDRIVAKHTEAAGDLVPDSAWSASPDGGKSISSALAAAARGAVIEALARLACDLSDDIRSLLTPATKEPSHE